MKVSVYRWTDRAAAGCRGSVEASAATEPSLQAAQPAVRLGAAGGSGTVKDIKCLTLEQVQAEIDTLMDRPPRAATGGLAAAAKLRFEALFRAEDAFLGRPEGKDVEDLF